MRLVIKYLISAICGLVSSVLIVSCFHREDPSVDSFGSYVVQCVISDTTVIQRMRLTVLGVGKTDLKVVPPDAVTTAYIAEGSGPFHYFEYEDDGVWTTVMEPQDGVNYSLMIQLKSGAQITSGVEFPQRPSIKEGVRYLKAYYPATNDIVDHVLWVPDKTKIEDIPISYNVWFFCGQPKGDGSLRYSDYVATRPTNRNDSFNKAVLNIWSLPCWSEGIVSQVGWKTELGYSVNTFNKSIRLKGLIGISGPNVDILSYDLIGDYDVDYALKHLPATGSEEGYVEPLLFAEVHIVSSYLDSWLKEAINDGVDDITDVLHANKAICDKAFHGMAYGVFGAEAILRFPLGSGQRFFAQPIEMIYNH